ncbi:MAG: hypothetical protein KDI62_05220 [Anaerolineae bacterium]|nr:hypothetical protein [Anaerolineae bacterium]MCB0177609.1 hypothetical protein [Anaerolineae bacterium]MCB9108850.1 hypothetical protein [Anaerolineales bacterium]
MQQLAIGQNVIHPIHGAGKITGVTEMNIVEEFTKYYVIEFSTKRLTLHVPVLNLDGSSIRQVMSENKADDVFGILQAEPEALPEEFKHRRRKLEDWLQSGRPVQIAQAVRALAWRNEHGGLSSLESRLFSQAKDMLVTEVALATDQDALDARHEIEAVLTSAMMSDGEKVLAH